MKCRKCREEIPDGSRFCMLCGAKQEVKAQSAKSRGNGQGSAIKRGSTWTAVWTVETFIGKDGKYKQRRKTKGGFKTKRDALAYAARPAKEEKKSPTLRYYWDNYEKSGFQKLSGSKKGAYKIAWKRLEKIAEKQMQDLTIEDLQSCIDSQVETYYPAKDMRDLLSALYKRAVAEGNARINLSPFITLPTLNEKQIEAFTEEELQKMWTAYGSGDRIMGCVLLMTYTGMMPGELFKAKDNMVDWERQEIVGCAIKTKKRKETPIVFPDILAPVILDLIQTSKSKKGYILGINKWTFYDLYHESIKKAGIRDLDPYSCRHTTATALALGNIAPSVIQEVMRHTKFATTQRYIHPDSASSHAAINTIGKGKDEAERAEQEAI